MWMFGALTFVGGILNSLQAGCNAGLNKGLSQPLIAAIIVALLNILTYLVLAPFVGGLQMPHSRNFVEVPWWAWFGGLFGAANVLNSILFAPRLGGGAFIGILTTAGIIASVIMDHYGIVGFAPHSINVPRVLGCLLMIGGMSLVLIY